MDERRTAAIVLGVLALIVVFFTFILPQINLRRPHTISFKNCTRRYQYDHQVPSADIERVAYNSMALCLCKLYDKNKDTAIAGKIMNIYKDCGSPISPDTVNTKNYVKLDSILKYRSKAFDTLLYLD